MCCSGGIPHYLLQFDPRLPLADNIEQNILRCGAVLCQDAELVLFGRAFDARLVEAAELEPVRLISVDELYR